MTETETVTSGAETIQKTGEAATESTETLLAAESSDTAQATGGDEQKTLVTDKPTPEESKAEAAKQPEGAPEKYEFKAPDGLDFDTDVIGTYSEVAKELDLTQENAQMVLDKLAPALADSSMKRIEAVRTEWEAEAKADKEFGGDKLNESLGDAKKFLDTFGTPELTDLLNKTGLGNNSELIRVFVRAAQAIGPDRLVAGYRGDSVKETDPAKVLFPDMN